MRGRDSVIRMAAAGVLCVSAACFHTTAPYGWLPKPEDVQRTAFGAWAHVQLIDAANTTYDGELIAVDKDSIHVLRCGALVSRPMGDVRKVTLTTFEQNMQDLQIWTLLGTLSTASHGFGAILSLPIWGMVDAASLYGASHAPVVSGSDAEKLHKFARFPQGIPAVVDRRTLQCKS